MIKNILKFIAVFVIGIVGGIFADQILWPYFIERPLFYKYRLEQAPVYVTERNEIIIQENNALQNAVKKVEKAVVGVVTETKEKKVLTGSGLIITSDGLMITLAELLPQTGNYTFFVNGKTPKYQVLKRHSEENLALVKIEEGNLSTIGFADFGKLILGERVFLIGAVFQKGSSAPLKMVNEGIVKFFTKDYIRTNIFEKNILSGSPLFNIKGELLGLNTIDSEGKVTAIPVTKIRAFLGF